MEIYPFPAILNANIFKDPSLFFENPFSIEDILVFDDPTLHRLLNSEEIELDILNLAFGLHKAPEAVVTRINYHLPSEQQSNFQEMLHLPIADDQIYSARERVLNALFWNLTYWKTPDLYQELIEGEKLHPDIFYSLKNDICNSIVLDAAAGSGRATLECLSHGASLVYAIDPCPGLLHILERRLDNTLEANRVILRQGSFDQLPLENDSVDIAITCSAFTSKAIQGGEPGLKELQRVTKSGGKLVIIWPLPQDYSWLASHGFQYLSFPPLQEQVARFRSRESAVRCASRFYAKRPEVMHTILNSAQPEVPYSVLGFEQPNDYCWLPVEKSL